MGRSDLQKTVFDKYSVNVYGTESEQDKLLQEVSYNRCQVTKSRHTVLSYLLLI